MPSPFKTRTNPASHKPAHRARVPTKKEIDDILGTTDPFLEPVDAFASAGPGFVSPDPTLKNPKSTPPSPVAQQEHGDQAPRPDVSDKMCDIEEEPNQEASLSTSTVMIPIKFPGYNDHIGLYLWKHFRHHLGNWKQEKFVDFLQEDMMIYNKHCLMDLSNYNPSELGRRVASMHVHQCKDTIFNLQLIGMFLATKIDEGLHKGAFSLVDFYSFREQHYPSLKQTWDFFYPSLNHRRGGTNRSARSQGGKGSVQDKKKRSTSSIGGEMIPYVPAYPPKALGVLEVPMDLGPGRRLNQDRQTHHRGIFRFPPSSNHGHLKLSVNLPSCLILGPPIFRRTPQSKMNLQPLHVLRSLHPHGFHKGLQSLAIVPMTSPLYHKTITQIPWKRTRMKHMP